MDFKPTSRIRELFEEALLHPSHEREEYLIAACASDIELLKQVRSLLQADESPASILDSPVVSTAAAIASMIADADLAGRHIDGFTFIERVGVGGMGAVYRARQENPPRDVAIKILHAARLTPNARRRFQEESEILARLNHPAIAQLYQVGVLGKGADVTTDTPYLALEYVSEAITITEFAILHDLSTQDRIRLFLQACDAVQYGHQRGVIHRDLKPANILVGASGQAKVIDFGIARFREQGDFDVTRTTDFMGSLAYLSPEQCAASDHHHFGVDVRSDLYSLGVVLYELICGRLPYQIAGIPLPDVFRTILDTQPDDPRTHDPKIDDDLVLVMCKALAKDPDDRYPTVSEFAADLKRYLGSEPIIAHRPSAMYSLRKYVARHKIGTAVGVLVTALVLTFGVTMMMMSVRITAESHAAEMERAKIVTLATFMTSLLDSADPYKKAGKDVTVRAVLDAAGVNAEGTFEDAPEIRVPLEYTVGSMYRKLGLFDQALIHLQTARARTDNRDPNQRLVTARIDLEIGRTMQNADDWKNGEYLLTSLLDSLSDIESPDIEDVRADAKYMLAMCIVLRGDARRAADLCESTSQYYLHKHGISSANYYRSLNGLAIAYSYSGNVAKARQIEEQVVRDGSRYLGSDSHIVLGTTHNLIGTYLDMGQPDAALAIIDPYCDTLERIFGEDHLEYLDSQDMKAIVYCAAGRIDEAQQIASHAVSQYLKVLGADHRKTLSAQYALAQIHLQCQEYDIGEHILRGIVDTRERLQGSDHVETITTKVKLAQTIRHTGNAYESVLMLRDLLAQAERVFEPESLRTDSIREALAYSLYWAGCPDEAIAITDGIYRFRLGTLGSANAGTQRALQILIEIHESRHDFVHAAKYRYLLEQSQAPADDSH